MRPRTIILALAVVLMTNTMIVLGAWWWFNAPPSSSPAIATGSPEANSSTPAGSFVAPVVREQPAEDTTGTASPTPTPRALSAQIDSPREGESVPRRFQASGRCPPLPAGQRLLLVVQTGRVFSPKIPLAVVNGENWSGTVNEFGMPVGSAFTVCLFQVSDVGVEEITQWHANGKATGKWPPYRAVPGGELLAKVTLRVGRGN